MGSLKIFIYFLLINFIHCYLNPYSRIQQQQQQQQQQYPNNNCPLKCPQQPPPPPPQSCPCIKAKNSTKCFAYDSRLQATSLDEAMFSFPDISDHSPNPPTLVPPSAIVHTAPKMQPFIHTAFTAQSNSKMMASDAFAPLSATSAASGAGAATGESSSGSCVSKQCEACRLHVLEGFSQALNASSQFNKRISGEHGEMNECPYVQTKQKEKAAQKEKLSRINSQNDHTVNQMVSLLKQAQKRKRRDISGNGINNDIDNDNLDSVSSVDQSALKDKLLGVSTKISCDYVRGEALNSDSPWCGLCNICWTWRKLPPNYFPSYLNEVSCDADNACLGGFGKCRSVLRTLTVLRNTANDASTAEQWEQQSINTIAACECQVESGTPLHSFIVR